MGTTKSFWKKIATSLGAAVVLLGFAALPPLHSQVPGGFAKSEPAGANPAPASQYVLIPHPLGMIGPDDTTTVSWEEYVPYDCYFRFGTSPGNYNLGAVPEAGQTKSATFVPSQVGLGAPGVYYAVITNSPDATISASEEISPEFLVIIESQITATVIGPKGTVTETTPTFEWQTVAGVPYYHVIISDNPFTIGEDENGQTTVQGANIIWQAITPNTSIRYGDVDPSDFFTLTNGTPPPLMSGLTYNWLVLNNYGNHPAFSSTVQGSVNEFVVDVASNLSPPQLVAPEDSSLITGADITFQWDAVEGAVNYKVSIFEQRDENGSTVSYPVWETITSNTLVDFPAGSYLINSEYVWKVLAWDECGGGVQSADSRFTYATTVGTMKVRTKTAAGQNLPRVELIVQPIEGSADQIPLLTDDYGFAKKIMRDGVYDVTAKKSGYENTTLQVTVPVDPYPDSTAGDFQIDIVLDESPSSISGRVYDTATGAGISNATVVATRTSDGTQKTAATNAEGHFLVGVLSGSWDVYAKKTGFVQSVTKTVSTSPGSLTDLGENGLGLTLKSGTLNGIVKTSSGKALQGALIRVYAGNDTLTGTTAANGTYSMTLTSKTWTIAASKSGYVSPTPQSKFVPVSGVATADFTLAPHANLISGYVSDGSKSLSKATVTATPEAGTPVSAETNNLGQYSLSLGSGTFTIAVAKSGYSGGQPVQVSVTVGQTVSGVNFTLTANPSSISGRVTTDGVTGVAGATVTNGTVSVLTTSSGNFTLSLAAGTHTLFASKAGYATSESQVVSLTPGQVLSGLDFRITPNAATVSGTVTGNGLPLYQALVTVAGSAGTFQTQTDAQGAYSISVQPGTYAVKATKAGYLEPASRSVIANPGQSIPNINFALILNKATISGVVKSTTGALLRNATVIATDDADANLQAATTTNVSGEYTLKVTGGRSYSVQATKEGYSSSQAGLGQLSAGQAISKTFQLAALPSSVSGMVRDMAGVPIAEVFVRAGSDSVKTNNLGKYTLFLQAGESQLVARKSGYTTGSQTIAPAPGQTLSGVDFQLDDVFATVSGTVKSAGTVLQGVVLDLQGPPGTATASTGLQGKFSFLHVLPGTYQLRVKKAGYAQKDTALTLSNKAQASVSFSLARLTGLIAGTVSAAGDPLPEATVKAVSAEGTFTAVSDAQGHYVLPGLPKTAYQVSAVRGGYASPKARENVVPDSNGVNFVLTPNEARISGEVQAGEVLLEGAKLSAMGAAGNTGFATSGANGSFAIENLGADAYTLSVEKPGYTLQGGAVKLTLAPGTDTTLTLNMDAISLSIAGRVLAGDTPVPDIPLELRGDEVAREAISNSEGRYTFAGLQPNTEYTVATNIFKAGYTEADTSVSLAFTNATQVDLSIKIAAGEIFGQVGVGQASITAEHADGRTFTTISKSDGSYKLSLLPAGAYRVVAARFGYEASPAEQQITLSLTEKKELNFTLTPNTGTLTGKIALANGAGIAGATITAVAPNRAPLTATSAATGLFSLKEMPAGLTYTVRAALAGYTVAPAEQQIALEKGQTATANFTVSRQTGSIAGRVYVQNSGTAVSDVLLSLLNTTTNQSLSLKSDHEGRFTFTALAAGVYKLSATRAGYTALEQTTTIELADGQSVSVEVRLQAETGLVSGIVRHRGRAIASAKVQISGPNAFTALTDNSGRFSIGDLPAGSYDIGVTASGYTAMSLPGFEVAKGSASFLPLAFPGARLRIRFTDGKNPVAGVRAQIDAPQNQAVVITDNGTEVYRGQIEDASESSFAFVSNAEGWIATDSSRLAGTYFVSIEKEGYLIPKSNHLQFELATDEFREAQVPLVFQHEPVTAAAARDSIRIELQFTAGLDPALVKSPLLWVKRVGSAVFASKPMQHTGGRFVGWIAPHTQSGEVFYYLTADYQNGSELWSYASSPATLQLNAKGILYRVQISPGGGVLQKGARARMAARPVDDTGANLAAAVADRGTITWEVLSGDSTARLEVDPENAFKAYLYPQIDGLVQVRVRTVLDGLQKFGQAGFQSKTQELQRIDIQAPKQASNATPVQLSFIATSTDSQTMRLDSEWRVEPAAAGTVTEEGLFLPADNFLGDVTLRLVDLTSQKSQAARVNLFAVIDSSTERTFIDGAGLRLQFQKNAVSRRQQISLGKPNLPDVKKYTSNWQVTGNVYELLPSGATFAKNPNLMLPKIRNMGSQTPTIGSWQQARLQWQPLQTSVSDSAVSAFIASFAQFAVLVGNEPLGVHGLSFLPSPFSPRRGKMRIGYSLSSQSGKAMITVRIYTLSGDLVRTLVDRETQYPGPHTSLAWDGLTDTGKLARNGRYMVEVVAENVGGKVRSLQTIVLIK